MSENVTSPALTGNMYLRVITVDDESSSIPEVLGITKERENELNEIIEVCFKENDILTDVFAEISKKMKHANELAYCIFHVGCLMGRQRSLNDALDSLTSALKRANGKSED